MDITKRGKLRAQLTKLCRNASDIIGSQNWSDLENSEDSEKMRMELECLKIRILSVDEGIKKLNNEIKNSINTEEEMDRECDAVIEYEDKAVTASAQLNIIIQRLQKAHQVSNITIQRNEPQVGQVASPSIASSSSDIKLKPIELKKFNGNFEDWLPFWEQYKIYVHENENLPICVKFNYLNNALEGKAAALIAGYLPTEQCYEEIITALKNEYGNAEKLVEKYVQKLINIKSLHSTNDVKRLRSLYNEVCSTMRTLTALKVNASQYSILIRSILLGAIPTIWRINYYKLKTNNEQSDDINSLLEFLRNEIEAIEKAKLSDKEEIECKKPTRTPTAASLLINSSHIKYCVFCKNSSHKTNECKSKLTIEEKKNILKKEGRCFRCTNKNHTSKFCKKNYIKCDKCNGRHITPLCEKTVNTLDRTTQNYNAIAAIEPTNKAENVKTQANATTSLNTVENNSNIFLQTAIAFVMSTKRGDSLLSRIIMDNGSQRTFITQTLKDKLKLRKCGHQSVKIMSFGENLKSKPVLYETVILNLKSQYNNEMLTINAIVVPTICQDTLPSAEKILSKLNIANWQLADINNTRAEVYPGINILIGQDYYWRFNTENCKMLENNLVAVNTFFGWTIQGGKTQSDPLNHVLNVNEQIEETFDVTKFWSLESIGINNSNQQNKAQAIELKINLVNERYQVNLPWKYDKYSLNNNRTIALKRLRTLTVKLLNNNQIENYNEIINEMLRNKIVEKVKYQQINSNPIYYMPHKAVYREDKDTTKTRIVFDASSSESGLLSLNDHLHQGEDMVADLLTMLLKFRCKKYAIIADIEKAFLQIQLDPDDRDVHRFWWYETLPKHQEDLPKPVEYRMTRLTFGITSSPYILASIIKQHLINMQSEQNYKQTCEKLKTAFYVDDLIISEDNEECAVETIEKAYEIMEKGKFCLKKWNSNKPEILKKLPATIISQNCNQKVLGVKWCTLTDEISLDINKSIEYIQSLTATKRNVLKAMAKIYDPLGMIGPVTVRIKILLQKVWNAGFDWDKLLPIDMMEEFVAWKNDLCDLTDFTMKRCLFENKNCHSELHIFADASPYAYGAVAYVRQVSENNIVSVNFICSKNRIRPLKEGSKETELTLPKLELTATLIAARMKVFLINSLSISFNDVWLWTDSTIALNWIKGRGKKVSIYVKTRVDEINRLTNIYNWNHCEGKMNPADLLTRGIQAKVLCKSELWYYGPSWLIENDIIEKCDAIATLELLTLPANFQITNYIQPIMTIENFSKIKKLLRVTAWSIRFIKSILKQTSNSHRDELTYLELQEAEIYWVKITQATYFKDEIEALLKNKLWPKFSKIHELNPKLNKGILRLTSRIHNENPIILPKCYFTKLLIREAHEVTLHGGVNVVLNQLRKTYWIVKGRQIIKNVINKCVTCKRLNGKPGSEPWTIMPKERLSTSRVFETTGIDFAGPLYIYDKDNEKPSKVYILLFTCAAIRAVHLELLLDMSTKSCVSALRRFFARYGTPKTIISDNARTFKRTDFEFRKLENLMKNSDVQTMAAHKQITWKYIPERAAWWGGFWERLVKSVKSSLKAVIGKAHLNYDELNTILTEVEGIINTRPLTYISNDNNDLEPLTPAHFINSTKLLIPADFNADCSDLAKSWQLRQSITKKYLKRWKTEYLGQLRNLHFNKTKKTNSIKIGDVVVVHEDNKPRLFWKLGLIKGTYPGRDGHVRVCDVQYNKEKILKRPVQLLYPLEISSAGGRM